MNGKALFFFSWLIFSLSGVAQTTNTKAILDFRRDILHNEKSGNGDTFSFKDNGTLLAALQRSGNGKTLYLPAGKYTLTRSLSLFQSGLHIAGAGIGKTVVCFTSGYEGEEALLKGNGVSNITIEGISFTGNGKKIKAALEFNSAPNKNRNITILNCSFENLWAQQAINFGGTAKNETHSNDNVLIDHCIFRNIYDPSYPIVTNDTDPRCDGVNLQQTTLRANIRFCTFEHVSGDGIFGWGWSRETPKADPLYGNWNIHHNSFSYCWMGIEVNGNGLGSGLYIHDNDLKYSTHNAGFLISVDSYKARVVHNTLLNVDRSLIEYTALEGTIADNTGKIITYSSQSGGVPPTEKYPAIAVMELYGYNNTIERNHFTLDRSHPDAFTPDQFNGIKLVGKTTDPQSQPLEYKGVTDFSAFWMIRNNTVSGFTKKAIDASNAKIRNVTIQNNVFTSSRNDDVSPIEIYGYHWKILNNTFHLPAAASPKFIIKHFYLQKEKTGSVAAANKIISKGWEVFDSTNEE